MSKKKNIKKFPDVFGQNEKKFKTSPHGEFGWKRRVLLDVSKMLNSKDAGEVAYCCVQGNRIGC